jgi:hypothetical protein
VLLPPRLQLRQEGRPVGLLDQLGDAVQVLRHGGGEAGVEALPKLIEHHVVRAPGPWRVQRSVSDTQGEGSVVLEAAATRASAQVGLLLLDSPGEHTWAPPDTQAQAATRAGSAQAFWLSLAHLYSSSKLRPPALWLLILWMAPSSTCQEPGRVASATRGVAATANEPSIKRAPARSCPHTVWRAPEAERVRRARQQLGTKQRDQTQHTRLRVQLRAVLELQAEGLARPATGGHCGAAPAGAEVRAAFSQGPTHGEPLLNHSQGDSYCDCPTQALPPLLAGARATAWRRKLKSRCASVSLLASPRGALLTLLRAALHALCRRSHSQTRTVSHGW